MSRFTFISEEEGQVYDDYSSATRSVEFTTFDLEHILDEFKYFLLGCGYEVEGNIEIVSYPKQATQENISAQKKAADYSYGQLISPGLTTSSVRPLTIEDLQLFGNNSQHYYEHDRNK